MINVNEVFKNNECSCIIVFSKFVYGFILTSILPAGHVPAHTANNPWKERDILFHPNGSTPLATSLYLNLDL